MKKLARKRVFVVYVPDPKYCKINLSRLDKMLKPCTIVLTKYRKNGII